jgi:hypothetical protein
VEGVNIGCGAADEPVRPSAIEFVAWRVIIPWLEPGRTPSVQTS